MIFNNLNKCVNLVQFHYLSQLTKSNNYKNREIGLMVRV